MSRVTDAGMLGEKKSRKEGIDAHQPFARQGHNLLSRFVEIALIIQRLQLRAEPLQNPGVVLVAKVSGMKRAPLELENKLPDHPFLVCRPIDAAERYTTFANRSVVTVP